MKVSPFAERIRTARIRARYSQEEVARFMRVTRAKVGAWETGTFAPTAPEAARLARIVGIAPVKLFGASGLAGIGIDVEQVTALYDAAPRPPAPRGSRPIKGYGSRPLPRLALPRCTACGRWIGVSRIVCAACGANCPDAPPRLPVYPVFAGKRGAVAESA